MRSKGLIILLAMATMFGLWQALELKQQLTVDRQRNDVLKQEIETLKQAHGAITGELQKLKQQLSDSRKNESELPRLRGEIARLRKQPGTNSTALSAAEPTSPKTANSYPPVETHSLKTQVQMPLGQTLIAGGWKASDGKRGLTLITPTIPPEAEGKGQVIVGSKFIEATEAAWQQLGLEQFQAESGQEPKTSLLNSEQAQSFFTALTNTSGVDVLSSPRILTADGREARISIGGERPGDTNPPGIRLNLLPSLSPGKTVDLQLELHITKEVSPTPAQ